MNTAQLCQHLAETLHGLKAKSIDAKMAQTVANLANAITKARRLQNDYNEVKSSPNRHIEGLE